MTTEVAGEELTLIGAAMSVSGKPVDSIEWRIRQEVATCDLNASFENMILTDDYLVSAALTVENLLDRFILEKEHLRNGT